MGKKRIRLFKVIVFLLFLNVNAQEQKTVWTKTALLSKNSYELRIIRNEFFARKGYVFSSEDLNEYFKNKKWYQPKENVQIDLTEVEKNTIDLIQEIEKIKKKEALAFLEPYEGDKRDTIKIDYHKNKVILEALTLFPYKRMGSWEWSQKERIRVVKFIKENNYIIDTDAIFLNISYINPYAISFGIVDGSWHLSVYPTSNDEFIMIVNDIVTGASVMSSYLFGDGKLHAIDLNRLLYNNVEYKLLQNKSKKCLALFEEMQPFFDYDFNGKELLEISSWELKKETKDPCFNGNTMSLRFNKNKRVFEVLEVSWK